MENATHALMMAASVLLLMLALAVSISSFTTLKTQVEDIVTAEEEFDLAKDENTGEYINYMQSGSDIRTVGVETIISSLRRAKKEDYNVYIYGSNTISALPTEVSSKLLVDNDKEQKYGSEILIPVGTKNMIKISLSNTGYQNINDTTMEALFEVMKDRTYKEYIGIYKEKTAEGVLEGEKTTRRVITFVETTP